MIVSCNSVKLEYARTLNMLFKPAATVSLLLLTSSQAPPMKATSRFGTMTQEEEVPSYEQYGTCPHSVSDSDSQ
jgi:hypothetical protein